MLILPYVVLTLFPIVALIYILLKSVRITVSNEYATSSITSSVVFMVLVLFSIYYALCIFSLYSLIKEDEKKRKIYKPCDTILIAASEDATHYSQVLLKWIF